METVDTDRSYFFKLKLVFTCFCPSADPQVQAFYGGRMTDDRLLAVKNATSEAIDHLHKSLESCPNAESEAPDPRGIKVRHAFVCCSTCDTINEILTKPQGIMQALFFLMFVAVQHDRFTVCWTFYNQMNAACYTNALMLLSLEDWVQPSCLFGCTVISSFK